MSTADVVPTRSATFADLESVPENRVGEIIDGELVVTPRPAPAHALVSSRLLGRLGPAFDDQPTPTWWILFEPELHLGADALVPDIAGWRRERLPRMPDTAAFDLAPDWICEVVSPSTAVLDRSKKLRLYARAGVSHAWIVDPLARSLEAYRREGERWLLLSAHGVDERVRVEPFETLELDLATLWP